MMFLKIASIVGSIRWLVYEGDRVGHSLGRAAVLPAARRYQIFDALGVRQPNDITPANLWGRIPVAVIQMHSVALLVMVIAALTSAGGRPPTNRPK